MTSRKRDLPHAKAAKEQSVRRASEIEKAENAKWKRSEAEQAARAASERERERLEALKKAEALIEKHGLIDIIQSEIREAIDLGKSSLNYVPRRPCSDPWVRWSHDAEVIKVVYDRAVKELKLKELGYVTRVQDDELIITWE